MKETKAGKDEKALSDVEAVFVAEYCANGFNGTQAYRSAYPKASLRTARANSFKLLTKAHIRAEIRLFVSEVLGVRKDTLDKEIIDLLLRRAFYDPLDYIDEFGVLRKGINRESAKGVIDGIVRKETKDSSWVELKMADRDRALEMLAKYVALIKPDPADAGTGAKIIVLPPSMTPDQWTKQFGPEAQEKKS